MWFAMTSFDLLGWCAVELSTERLMCLGPRARPSADHCQGPGTCLELNGQGQRWEQLGGSQQVPHHLGKAEIHSR